MSLSIASPAISSGISEKLMVLSLDGLRAELTCLKHVLFGDGARSVIEKLDPEMQFASFGCAIGAYLHVHDIAKYPVFYVSFAFTSTAFHFDLPWWDSLQGW